MIKMNKNLFNPYSFLLLSVFFCTTLSMQYHISQFSVGGFFLVSPLIALAILCSGKIMQLEENNNNAIITENEFKRDVFLISYSFLIASLISLLPEYDNSDAREWWGISVYYVSLIGIIFSWFFAYFNRFLRLHKVYTNIFSLVVIIAFSLPKLWPIYVSVIFIGEISFFMVHDVYLRFFAFTLFLPMCDGRFYARRVDCSLSKTFDCINSGIFSKASVKYR